MIVHETATHQMTVEYSTLVAWFVNSRLISDALKGIPRYQRGRQKSLSRKTDKTMANKMKRKTNIEHTTLHWKLKLEKHEPYKNQGEFRSSWRVSNSCSTRYSGIRRVTQ